MQRVSLVFVSALLLVSGCSSQTGRTSMARTELCGQKVGYNAVVSDVSAATAPPLIEQVTTGSVVILQVAPCGHGVTTRLDPTQGAGRVTQHVRDPQGLDVGLVIDPVVGKTLRISKATPSGSTLLATIDIKHP